jgi:hypothetical protein
VLSETGMRNKSVEGRRASHYLLLRGISTSYFLLVSPLPYYSRTSSRYFLLVSPLPYYNRTPSRIFDPFDPFGPFIPSETSSFLNDDRKLGPNLGQTSINYDFRNFDKFYFQNFRTLVPTVHPRR